MTKPPTRRQKQPTRTALRNAADFVISSSVTIIRFLRIDWIVIAVLLLGGIWWLTQFHRSSGPTQTNKTATVTTTKQAEVNNSPTFTTVLPDGKTADALGGWKRVSPESSTPAYAYKDTIKNVSVSVTEQTLPQSFESDLEHQIEELAKNYGATQRIPATAATVYVSNPATGPQYIIGAKYNLLILIKANSRLSNDDLVHYFSSLQ